MLYPILPVFLTQTLTASGSVVGLIDGFAQATQNIVQGFAGTLSDKLRRRKPIALAGYFLAAIGKPLMGLATVWQVVFGARLLDRLGAGARSAPRDALIASSVVRRKQRPSIVDALCHRKPSPTQFAPQVEMQTFTTEAYNARLPVHSSNSQTL